MRFIALETVGSTNAEARRLAEQGDLGPLWVRADKQTDGRGRRGREWYSPRGNLFCTGLYSHFGNAQQAALISFVAALSVADLVRCYIKDAAEISLKWPNDVLVNGAKISGILLETGNYGGKSWIAIGIGVNLVAHPKVADYGTTDILSHMPEESLTVSEPLMSGPDAALAILSSRFEHWRHILMTEGFEPIRRQWLRQAKNIPGSVTVRLPTKSFTGEATGLGKNGELQVRLPNGTMTDVHAGDVFFG